MIGIFSIGSRRIIFTGRHYFWFQLEPHHYSPIVPQAPSTYSNVTGAGTQSSAGYDLSTNQLIKSTEEKVFSNQTCVS
jgi:hypothetical protein